MHRKPMSAVLEEMAKTALLWPEAVPTAEAIAATLLLTHVAWNRAIGDVFPDDVYQSVLTDLEKANPDFWRELQSRDCTALITGLIAYKWRHYAQDQRRVVSCGILNQKVRAEWMDR